MGLMLEFCCFLHSGLSKEVDWMARAIILYLMNYEYVSISPTTYVQYFNGILSKRALSWDRNRPLSIKDGVDPVVNWHTDWLRWRAM